MEHVWEYNKFFFRSHLVVHMNWQQIWVSCSLRAQRRAHTIHKHTRCAPKQQQVQLSAIASLIVYKHAQFFNSQQLPTILFSLFFLSLSLFLASSRWLCLLALFSIALFYFLCCYCCSIIASTQIRYMTFFISPVIDFPYGPIHFSVVLSRVQCALICKLIRWT